MTDQLNFQAIFRLVVTSVLVGLATALAEMAGMKWYAVAAIAVTGGALLASQARSAQQPGRFSRGLLWLGTVASVPALWRLGLGAHTWDYYYGLIACFIGIAIWTAKPAEAPAPITSWRALSLLWGLAGCTIFTITAYFRNERLMFFASIALTVALLIAAKAGLRLPPLGIQSANTLLLLLPGFCLADFVLYPDKHTQAIPAAEERPFSYETFAADPGTHAHWWRYYQQQLGVMYRTICLPDPTGKLQFQVRSNVAVRFCENEFKMNNFGFRGRDIRVEKGDTYRIVALGESTTFGITVAEDDRPWSEWLEAMIRKEIQADRPVEVINAGVPSFTLEENLIRLRRKIMPLKPDMIISYHGYNGFGYLEPSLAPVRTRIPPPRFPQRPLKMLAQVEYRIKLMRYTDMVSRKPAPQTVVTKDPLSSEYAQHYRSLIELCRENNVRLVVATYSMAVNEQSDPDVRAFYHRFTPLLRRKLKANVAHTRLVKELTRQNPEVCLVDTQPVLDGKDEYFIDLMHLTTEGKRKLAEAMFGGIRKALEARLGAEVSHLQADTTAIHLRPAY